MRRLCAAGALPLVRLGPPRGMQTRRRNQRGTAIGDRRQYTIPHADVISFLANRRFWMTWEASDVRDAGLRRVAELYRQATPGEWMSLRACVIAQHYAPNTTNEWVARGWPGPGWILETWGTTRIARAVKERRAAGGRTRRLAE